MNPFRPFTRSSPLRLALALLSLLAAQADAIEDRVLSPDLRYEVTPIEALRYGQEASSYAIRLRRTGKTLATCPEDDRFSSAPGMA